jgi:hypothetical protein
MKNARLTRLPILAIALFSIGSIGADCNGDIVQDPTFRDWCGASLCSWNTVKGQVHRVATWNENDFGVAFDDSTEIAQATQEHSDTRCILFTSVADLDPAADVTISADFNSDGSVEYSAPLASTRWKEVQVEITAPAAYDGITFAITKNGTGTAILAEMRIQAKTGCTAPPPEVKNLALGEACSDSTQCGPGLVCDDAFSLVGSSLTNIGKGSCAQCDTQTPCPNGQQCTLPPFEMPTTALQTKALQLSAPQCDPGKRRGASGVPCIAGADCASGMCTGAVPVPLTGDPDHAPLDGGTCNLDLLETAASPSDNCFGFTARGGRCQ